MFIESLDPRRLLSAGPDAMFADAGQYTFPATFRPDTAVEESIIAGDNGSVFVVGTARGTSQYSVTKLDKNGHLIAKFGDAGYARIPFKPEHTAYDAANGLLYVSRQSQVARLKPTGAFDTGYGENGLFSYTLATPPGDDASASTRIEALAPKSDGSLLLGVDRRWRPQGGRTTQDLSLIKARPTGSLDRRYGTNGVTRLLDGTIDDGDDANEAASTQRLNIGVFAELKTNNLGIATAVLTAVDGTRDVYEAGVVTADTATRGRYFIKSRAVSFDGDIYPETAHSWKIADNTADTEPSVEVQFAGWDNRIVHAVVTPSSGSASVTPPTYLYTLRAGKKPAPQLLPTAGLDGVSQFTRSADGTYLAADYGPAVTRLRPDFTPDTTFGDHGVIRPTHAQFAGYYSTIAYGDNGGRVYAFEYFDSQYVIERFR